MFLQIFSVGFVQRMEPTQSDWLFHAEWKSALKNYSNSEDSREKKFEKTLNPDIYKTDKFKCNQNISTKINISFKL